MKELQKEIKLSKEYVEDLKEEFNNTEPTKQRELERIAKRISEFEYYIMGLEFGLEEMKKGAK